MQPKLILQRDFSQQLERWNYTLEYEGRSVQGVMLTQERPTRAEVLAHYRAMVLGAKYLAGGPAKLLAWIGEKQLRKGEDVAGL